MTQYKREGRGEKVDDVDCPGEGMEGKGGKAKRSAYARRKNVKGRKIRKAEECKLEEEMVVKQ